MARAGRKIYLVGERPVTRAAPCVARETMLTRKDKEKKKKEKKSGWREWPKPAKKEDLTRGGTRTRNHNRRKITP